jgi:hypothetical protein
MPQLSNRRKRTPTTVAIVLLALASVLLAACGGSSKSSSSTTTTSASAAATTTPTTSAPGKLPGAANPGRFLALRECLKKNGITLPQRKPGQGPGAGGLGSGATLPAGVSRAQYEAILKQCGGGFARGRGKLGKLGSRLDTPEAKKALSKFAACMRENGIKIGEPNTSGKGSIFNTKGINTTTAAFATAETKCRNDLRGAFGGSPGAAAGG